MQILFHILHFWLNWHTCQRYKFYIWHATDIHTVTHTHVHTDACTHAHTDAHRHTLRHTQTHACLYIHTYTHTDVHMGNVSNLLLQPTFKLKWAKIVTFNGNSKEIITSNPLLS